MSRLKLGDHATVIVIGAGPAGSFFAIHLLREARKLDKVVHVTLVEKKSVPECPGAELPTRHREALRQGCAYCAGGLSPRLLEALASSQISLHEGVPQSEVKRIEIWAQWKAIALHVPSGKKMLSVYRGTRPQIRDKPFLNFDSCLLDHALDEGEKVITGEVIEIVRAPDTGKPRVLTDAEPGSLEADLVVYAAGVNQIPGMELENSRLVKSLKEMMPGFVPPRARRTLIFELDAGQEVTGRIRNDIFFMLHGSDGLDLEMVSIVPKGRFITISLIGRSIDSAKPKDRLDIIDRFLQIPHIKRLSLKELVGEHPEFERMYAIRIQAPRKRIFEQLGKFGDPDRGYFLPKRMIEVKGLSRSAHGAVTTIHYKVSPKFLSFFLELIEIHPDRRLIYRVRDGFPAGGVLVFDIEGVDRASADNDYLLSLYVAFDFPRALLWRVGRLIFPAFTHDVLWNHGLCKLKDILEAE